MRAWQWDHNIAGEATKASIKSTKGITRDWESIPQCSPAMPRQVATAATGSDHRSEDIGGGILALLIAVVMHERWPSVSTKYQKIGVAVDA